MRRPACLVAPIGNRLYRRLVTGSGSRAIWHTGLCGLPIRDIPTPSRDCQPTLPSGTDPCKAVTKQCLSRDCTGLHGYFLILFYEHRGVAGGPPPGSPEL
jgi:hypothetical protein